ncbi:ABC transporter ATP-binding protein [Fimbriimonas ginsengisoli]|uniref:ABC transporter, ATP-binding protein, putative n=1 Tax=Fimbriimonas ginsengisoli Gsoil 348 TaxID=661478 RepID=A0A068NWL3_FIMGI|nr:ATP-binding cassette domain-containing protein [Fimbriimonas ginsengisoli]AIE87757.1 ABC transporter, ATP-binding protein, putative [Fimbriimonas ginsengisoli Gsoil 348]
MVRTHELKKYFRDAKKGDKKAVDGVTFEARPGRILGLLGVNGAGKTTTLRMLSTVIKPTSGSAEVAGFNVLEHPEKVRASIGFMSTSTSLYGRLTAKELIAYFGGLYGLEGERLQDRIRYVTQKLQLEEFSDRLCDKLSTGQKQRVNIARTILHDPPVLFFDEPTAGLDVVASQSVMEFIEEARDAGKTIVFSTHIMSEVERLCDEIVVIHDGVAMGEGTVASLKAKTGQETLEKAFLSLVGFQPTYAKVPA